jgi:hypothetical protein
MSATGLIFDDAPASVTLRDAVASRFKLIPGSHDPSRPKGERTTRPSVLGCLYDADGGRVDLSLRRGRINRLTREPKDPDRFPAEQRGLDLTRLAGRTLFLGMFMNHYGHFITESLSRYWWPERAEAFDHVVAYPYVHDRGQVFIQPFHRYLAGALGIPLDRVTILDDPVRFDEIVVPEQLWVYDDHANVHLRALYPRISERHLSGAVARRVFLSRGVYPGARVVNAPRIEEVFAGFGFSVIYPEEIPIERQLDLYANCEILAGFSGSALHNCLFSRPGTLTIEVGDRRTPLEPHIMQQMANELSGVDARFLPYHPIAENCADPTAVAAALRDILGERPRHGPVLALHARRLATRLFTPRRAALRKTRYPTRGRR